jgi:hypothetical protein
MAPAITVDASSRARADGNGIPMTFPCLYCVVARPLSATPAGCRIRIADDGN